MKNVTVYTLPVWLIFIFIFLQTIQVKAQALNKFLNKVEKSINAVEKTLNEVDRTLYNIDKTNQSTSKKTDKSGNKTDSNKPHNQQTANNRMNSGRNTGNFYDKQRANFIDNKNDLFYCLGKNTYNLENLYTQDEIIQKTSRNILTKDKDETVFLRKTFIYHINNKKSNKDLLKCDESSLIVSVFDREASGLPKKVVAFYYYRDNANNVLPKKYEIQVFFDNGLSYYVWYPNENLYPEYPEHEGAFGSLVFTGPQIGEMVSLNDRDNLERKNYRINVINPKINDSLSKLIVKKYPGVNYSSCLSREVINEAKQEVTTYVNGYGDKRDETEYYTDYHIKVENKCNKTLKVIGILQGYANGATTFEFVTRTFKPKQVIKFTRSSNDLAGGMIASILTGTGEVQDIDLSKINKKYDVEEGGQLQYLRIVETK